MKNLIAVLAVLFNIFSLSAQIELTDSTSNDWEGGIDVTITPTPTGKFKLTYIVDGEAYNETDIEYGTAITPIEEPTKEGHTFSGWSEIPATMPAHNVEVNGSFTANKYKVIFSSDGAVIKEETLPFGTSITAPANPTKTGYTFTGWNPAVDATVPAHDVTYTAEFTVNIYKVSYYVGDELVHEDEVAFGNTFSLWNYMPDEDGFVFNGWIGETYDTMPAHDISYKADITSGIEFIKDNPDTVLGIFTLDGKKVDRMSRGVYVIKMKNGSTMKYINNK